MHLRCLLLIIALVSVNALKQRFDGNLLVSVTPSEEEHYQFLSNLENANEIDIWNEIRRNTSVHIMFHKIKQSWLMSAFEALHMKPVIMVDDVQKLFDQEERTLLAHARSGVPRDILDTFYDYDEYSTWLNQMAATYPNLADLQSLGKTVENRDVWLMILTANSGLPKKTAFIDCGIHAREWISPATCAYFINQFLTAYSSGDDARTILDSWELHIVPVLNPDGYAYTHSTNRMWRKNRRVSSGGCVGTDLNRNFGYMWNTNGSSADPCSETYRGGSAMSENEAKALERYMTGKPWTTYLTFHSYGQWWFTNWGYTTQLPPSYELLVQRAQIGANAIQSVNGRSYTIGSSAQLLYISTGCSEDWTAGTLGILYSYSIELPPVGGNGFVVPTCEIRRTGGETYTGIVAYLNSF